MENVTDRTSNPFGLNPPCEEVVPGYGDANADFHVIGDHSGSYGGRGTGVPFTGELGMMVQEVLHEVGLIEVVGDEPLVDDLFMSYLYMGGDEPCRSHFSRLERYFDAELRAINAHVLVPVGERAVGHVLREYTAQYHKLRGVGLGVLHGEEVRGSGFLVLPLLDPGDWCVGDGCRAVEVLGNVLSSDYRQTKGVATRFG